MKKKQNQMMIGIIIIIVIILIGILALLGKNLLGGKKSIEIPLEKESYLAAVEIKADLNCILVINEKEKVSNLLFLDQKSVEILSDQKIEGKSIANACKKIVDLMKNSDAFKENFQMIDYGNSLVFSKVKEEMNKEFVVYGVNKEIETGKTSLEQKLTELSIKKQKDEESSLEQLYYYSQELLQK